MLDRSLFLNSVERLLELHGAALRSLVGQRLEASWVAWDTSEGEWWADEAVLLQVGGRQLEIVCFRFDEVALTWDEIDTGRPPRHVTDWGEADLEWSKNGHPVLAKAVGGTLQRIHVLECAAQGRWHETWLLGGLEFEFSSGLVRIVNALDENGLEGESDAGSGLRRFPV